MSERPIEEVIGWKWNGSLWCLPGSGGYRNRATADDLAKWLDATVGHNNWDPFKMFTLPMYGVMLRGPDGCWPTDVGPSGPTILAALTAAVRKVAGDE